MGLQDRDYYREPSFQTTSYHTEHTAIFYLIVMNVGLWLADTILTNGMVSQWCALRACDFVQPTHWYRFLTYGFCHASEPMHVIGNMLGLFFLGRSVEARYGKREFLFFYLISILVGGIYWSGTSYASLVMNAGSMSQHEQMIRLFTPLVGASGGVTAVVILFALNFPRVMVYLFGLLPMPAFVFGILLVLMDLSGTQSQTNVAHSVHLAGAGFALLYFISRFRFCSVFGHGRPRVRAWDGNPNSYGGFGRGASDSGGYQDDEDDYVDDSYGYAPASKTREELQSEEEFQKLQVEVEALLKKISQQGMQSLTPAEMARLREASQKYRSRR